MEGRITLRAPLGPRPLLTRDGTRYQPNERDEVFARPEHEAELRALSCVDPPAPPTPTRPADPPPQVALEPAPPRKASKQAKDGDARITHRTTDHDPDGGEQDLPA